MNSFLLLSILLLARSSLASNLRGNRRQTRLEDCLPCQLVESDAHHDDDLEAQMQRSFACMTNGGVYEINLPSSVEQSFTEHSSYCIAGATIDEQEARVHYSSETDFIPSEETTSRRGLNEARGRRSVLAIRVKSIYDEEPTESNFQVIRTVFGGFTASIQSVADQYRAMSHGLLDLEPANGPGIVNGMAEIIIDQRVKGALVQKDLINQVLAATEEQIGKVEKIADHVMFCMPNGSSLSGNTNWAAFTYLGVNFAFFQQERCTSLSHVVHEFGHALGYRHSGQGLNEYADESDYMGYSVFSVGSPLKSFNAHKHWLTSWFDDYEIEVDPRKSGSTLVHLDSFTKDFWNIEDGNNVLLKVGEFYLNFNRADEYNVETPAAFADRVTITRAESADVISSHQAALSTADTFTATNWDGKGHDLKIEVCEIDLADSHAIVSVHLQDGRQQSSCGNNSSPTTTNTQLFPEEFFEQKAPTKVVEKQKSYSLFGRLQSQSV